MEPEALAVFVSYFPDVIGAWRFDISQFADFFPAFIVQDLAAQELPVVVDPVRQFPLVFFADQDFRPLQLFRLVNISDFRKSYQPELLKGRPAATVTSRPSSPGKGGNQL